MTGATSALAVIATPAAPILNISFAHQPSCSVGIGTPIAVHGLPTGMSLHNL